MATITGFHHTALQTTRFDDVVAFYTGALGLRVRITWGAEPARAAMIDAGDGNYVEVFEKSREADTGETAILHFALRTDDCAAMTERARTAGATVTMEPKKVTIASSEGPIPVRISFFRGLAGEVVELFENTVL